MTELTLKSLPGAEITSPLVLVVMDGIGLGAESANNGVHVSYTPMLDELLKERLQVRLKAHGPAVGLPSEDDMGNSEVGHNALGAGRIIFQGAKLVNEAIASGDIFSGDAWKKVKERAGNGGTVHFIGLVSDGKVHSHIDHLYALLDRCAEEGFARVRVHGLLDGRDVGQRSALDYFEPLEKKLASLSSAEKDYRIASGGGRMVTTMDRYNADWSVVKNGWDAHVLGKGRQFSKATEAIKSYYEENPDTTDQYMDSFVVAEEGKPVGTIEDGDAVVFFNFRGDRAIE
ncbi:MAG TPA: 2,3-bisphosphoglycerate-independent phosphoglycerate mutase, partial [Desulfopila sp.]|nr:2,3-bisphosphoglycerate-independent phosphoglycerate mutase [Desulfopila sp.]